MMITSFAMTLEELDSDSELLTLSSEGEPDNERHLKRTTKTKGVAKEKKMTAMTTWRTA